MVMIVSTHSRSAASPRSAWICRFLPSNLNGLVTTAIVSAPELAGQAGDHRCGAGAGTASKTGRDEHHVGARERLNEAVGVLERSFPPDVRVGACAEPFRQLAADLNLDRRGVHVQRLHVGVGDDELDSFQSDSHHPVDRVAAATADAHHLDSRARPALISQLQTQY